MKKRRIASALLSGAMLMSMCCFGASATESENDVIIFGDLNLDGSVNLLDAITNQKYIINALSLDDITAVDENLLDINKDGTINLLDAIALQKHLVALDVKEYIGKIVYEWVVDYKIVHHPATPAVTKTIHHDAVTHEEPVYDWVSYHVCNQCGTRLDKTTLRSHMVNSDGKCFSWYTKDEKVQTGTKTVVDQEAWDETVVVTPAKEAWDEKVENGGHWEYY